MKNIFPFLKSSGSASERPIDERVPYEIPDEIYEKLNDWKASIEFKRIQNSLREAYISFQSSSSAPHPDIDFMQQDASSGFILDVYNLNLTVEHCLMLLTYWRDKLLEVQYFDSMSDIRLEPKGQKQASYFRHYLKPSKRKLGPADQKYGNVEMVLYSLGEQPQHIKFQVNAYRDAKYDEAEDFGHLIFQVTSAIT